ncbi:MAG TPA: ABC transporter ATP-binding protein [Acidobacteriota bacterium]|nr:ABC transporter ATP-binding protein [Acidobacteriota bacterium]
MEIGKDRMPILVLKDVRKIYRESATPVEAIRGLSLEIEKGEFLALMGPSGCGKSTLLHLCGAMDRATAGEIWLEDRRLGDLSDQEMTLLRRRRVGFVFQFFNLLPTLNVVENIALPLLLDGSPDREARRAAEGLAHSLDLGRHLRRYPAQLSGGEMQRVALARAIIHKPALVIADEPTGSLDSENGSRILELFQRLNRESGLTILLATHSVETAAAANRILRMRDGRLC